MKLKSLEQNKAYQKRKYTQRKDPYELPKLVQPEFTIPIIKCEDDFMNSLDLSERKPFEVLDKTLQSDRMRRSVSNSFSKRASKKDISYFNPSERYANYHSDPDQETYRQKQDLDADSQSKFEFLSDKGISMNPNGGSNQLENSIILKHRQAIKKRQSKYHSDKDSDYKTRRPSIGSKDLQFDTNQENGQKFKSNFSYMPSIREKLTKLQRKVISIGYIYTFIVRLKSMSGIQKHKITYSQNNKSSKNIEQLRLLNDFSQFNDKKFQHIKRENNVVSQSFVNLLKLDSLVKKKKQLSIFNSIANCIKSIPVIHPNSAKLFLWDITNFFFILLNLTYIPIETAINSTFREQYGPKWQNIQYYLKKGLKINFIKYLQN